jgi:hypothetical protein
MRIIALLFTFFLLLLPQARAGDDVAAAQSVIRSQAEAFARDDAAAAYAFAAPEIHELYPKADVFLGMVQRGYAPVYRHKSFEFGEARAVDGKIAQAVHIIDADGVPWDALYTLEQQGDGSLKILGCALIKSGEGV